MKILVIEDNPADVEMIRELLSDHKESSFKIVCADRLSAAKPFFAEGGIDIIILDLGLPDSQGLDTIRRVREHAVEVPIVVLTMLDNEETGLNALKEGAQDYLVKGQMNGPLIVRSLRYAVERGRNEKELKKSHDHLKEMVAEKETLLREIHHRVKNNLQLISGLLDMTRMSSSDESTNSILTDIMLKIQTMAQIHTRLYESKQFGKINITDQCRDQVTALSNIFSHKGHEISCEINPEEVFLPVDQALPCALVLNEILSNAYKHAFKGRKTGKIEISALQVNGQIRIAICDNGVGLPDNFEIGRSNSLGITLIRTIVQHQLKGSLMFKSQNGTKISIEFPVIPAGT
ncbi:MAG: histidine kinase dimerization/phosphoacceptor domain -containing protein [Methanoregula sp.]|nr:histidine kinase dimerization/phosphoacceptor domain -containing protein [Methanoregula sp.]